MSEFDKEAERERLREKFAEEEADRESARHMSELLLQGMTMTDRHCPECGAPLFRDGDQVFCPECERQVVDEDDATAEEPQPEPSAEASPPPTNRPTGGTDPRSDLEAALSTSAAAAAAADDPRTRREHLEAAKSAIEAIRALDRE